ncbi:MAG: hypothetical protein AABX23_03735 [Nanoarchaeota archaeon]
MTKQNFDTTSEAISRMWTDYCFKLAKENAPDFSREYGLDVYLFYGPQGISRAVAVGDIVKTSEGIYVNPPRDKEGIIITDEYSLKKLRDKSIIKIVPMMGSFYLGENCFGFAEYSSFTRGGQSVTTFVKEGLARVLEGRDDDIKPSTLGKLAYEEPHNRRVTIWGFEKVSRPSASRIYIDTARSFSGSALKIFEEAINK